MRTCDLPSIALLAITYIVGIALCTLAYMRRYHNYDRKSIRKVAAIAFMLCFSLPGLFALERGNYVVIAFMLLACVQFSGWMWFGALALGAAINLKQYLILLWLVPAIKSRYRYLLQSIGFAVGLNAVSQLYIRDANYSMLISNMLEFSNSGHASFFEKIWYTTSVSAWWRAVEFSAPLRRQLSDGNFLLAYHCVSIARWLSLSVSVLVIGLCIRTRFRIDADYLAFVLLICLLVATDSVGGYSILLLLPFLPGAVLNVRSSLVAPLLALLLTPLDAPLGPSRAFELTSYLSGRPVVYNASITIGAYARPILLFILLVLVLRDLMRRSFLK